MAVRCDRLTSWPRVCPPRCGYCATSSSSRRPDDAIFTDVSRLIHLYLQQRATIGTNVYWLLSSGSDLFEKVGCPSFRGNQRLVECLKFCIEVNYDIIRHNPTNTFVHTHNLDYKECPAYAGSNCLYLGYLDTTIDTLPIFSGLKMNNQIGGWILAVWFSIIHGPEKKKVELIETSIWNFY